MSQPVQLLLMFFLLVPFWYQLRRDFIAGLSYGMVILIACTHFLRIPLPGALPELTIHRIVIISLFVVWIRITNRKTISEVPLARHIFVWSGIAMLSLLGSIDHSTSIKRYFDYVLEFFLLYFILSTTIQNREQALRILRSACLGLFIVAALAFLERYAGINVVERFILTEAVPLGDVTSTYRHRILLGTGMAMAWPLAFWSSQNANSGKSRRRFWICLLAVLAACYFSRSRGPWLAAVLAAAVLFVFGSVLARKRLLFIASLGALLLLARPGVLATITGLAEATVDTESLKGGTFLYRLELWKVALSEISKSPWRLLFGFGPGAGASQSVVWDLSYRDKDFVVTSWDNDFAYALYQYGFLGFFATVALYGTISWRLLSYGRSPRGQDRDLFISLAACTLVLFFMMSNVMIFARQLYYLLWTVTAIGFTLKIAASSEPEAKTKVVSTSLPPSDQRRDLTEPC